MTTIYSSTANWLGLLVSVELDARIRMALLGVLAGLAALGSLLLLVRRGSRWPVLVAAVVLGLGLAVSIGAVLAVPRCDVLTAVPAAAAATGALAAALGLGLAAAAIGALPLLAWVVRRPGLAEVGCASVAVLAGAGFAAAQLAPLLALRREVLAVGPLPGPLYLAETATAHVGATVARAPTVVHHLVEGSPEADRGWELDRPRPVLVSTAGPGRATVVFSRGPVRIETEVPTHGVVDRGPAAWPLDVGDAVALGPAVDVPPTLTLRVTGAEEIDGYRVFVVEIGEGTRTETIRVVRQDGALSSVAPYETDDDGNLALSPWFAPNGDGTCAFRGMSCPCEPAWTGCAWDRGPSEVGQIARVMLGLVTLGTSELLDVPLGEASRGQLVVLSRAGTLPAP